MALKAVLAGAGFWASHAHLPALRTQDELEIIGIADPILERARTLAEENDIAHASTSLNELLGEQPDLVVIAAPTDVHAPLVGAALSAGAAVLCEKPLANSVDIARDLARIAHSSSVIASVGYSFRYGPALQALKRDIQAGTLGRPWLLEMFEYNAQFHPARGKSVGWKGDPAQARAGALLEYGSHLIDMARWLAGPITEVHSSLAQVLPNSRLDDIAVVQARFDAPAIGVLVSGWVLTGSVPGIKIRFHGSEGLGEVEMNETVASGQAYRRFTLDGVPEEMKLEPLIDPVFGYAVRHQKDILSRIRGEETPYPGTLPSFEDGVRVQEVLEAALRATGGWCRPGGIPS